MNVKKLMMAVLAVACCVPLGAADAVLTTLRADGSTNVWTQADLVAALGLLNRKYHRDVKTSSGRAAWHGARVREIVDTNALTRTAVYEDGTRFVDRFTPVKPKTLAERTQRLPMTNGIPASLAAARVRRAAEKAVTNVVTITVSP